MRRPLPSSVGFPVEWRAAWLVFCIGLASFFAATEGLSAQVEASPVLEGRALLGDTVLTRGTVVLHHVSNATQGEVDSTALAGDGSFQLRLPNVPDPERGDVFLASILHDGVTYFGPWITTANQLDSAYAIQAYDTAMAAAEAVTVVTEWTVADVAAEEAAVVVGPAEGAERLRRKRAQQTATAAVAAAAMGPTIPVGCKLRACSRRPATAPIRAAIS